MRGVRAGFPARKWLTAISEREGGNALINGALAMPKNTGDIVRLPDETLTAFKKRRAGVVTALRPRMAEVALVPTSDPVPAMAPPIMTPDIRREDRVDDQGWRQKVYVRGPSLRNLSVQQTDALTWVTRDWEMQNRALSCRGFEPHIPGGKSHAAYLRSLDATERLKHVAEALGTRDYCVLIAFIMDGGGMVQRGASLRDVSRDVKKALDKAYEAYSGGQQRKDKVWEIAEEIVRQMEREVG